MSYETLANGYAAALKIVLAARCENVELQPVWEKVNRVVKYLNSQAAAELAQALN